MLHFALFTMASSNAGGEPSEDTRLPEKVQQILISLGTFPAIHKYEEYNHRETGIMAYASFYYDFQARMDSGDPGINLFYLSMNGNDTGWNALANNLKDEQGVGSLNIDISFLVADAYKSSVELFKLTNTANFDPYGLIATIGISPEAITKMREEKGVTFNQKEAYAVVNDWCGVFLNSVKKNYNKTPFLSVVVDHTSPMGVKNIIGNKLDFNKVLNYKG